MMATLLAYMLPPADRHEERVRAGLAIVAEMAVNLRACGTLARLMMEKRS